MVDRVRKAALLVAVLTACTSPPPDQLFVNDSTLAGVERWLTCFECNDERAALQSLDDTSFPLFVDVLNGLPQPYESELREQYGRRWASVPQARTLIDSTQYVDAELDAFRTAIQGRAAIALGDLGATAEIDDALQNADPWGLSDHVRLELERARYQGQGLVPPLGAISIRPSRLGLGVAASVLLNATVTDSLGFSVDRPVVWASLNSGVATVDAAGTVTGIAPGSTRVRATVDALTDSIRVDVADPVPILSIDAGDFQVANPGSQLIVRVMAADGSGTSLSGVQVEWEVLEGEGTVGVAASPTDVDGRAETKWFLGTPVGLNRLRVWAAGGAPVVFHALGIGTTATGDRSPASLEGLVLTGGAASAGLRVRLAGPGPDLISRTDARGWFGFSAVPDGAYTLTVEGAPAPGFLPQAIALNEGLIAAVVFQN